MDQELEHFKTRIDLREFAAAQGYELDNYETTKSYAVMRNSHGDKVIIHQNSSGQWLYCCTKNSEDKGTIIDFLIWRGLGQRQIGKVRMLLREWKGGSGELSEYFKAHKPRPMARDRAAVVLEWEQARPVSSLSYLIGRGIGRALLELPAFAEAVRVDHKGNVLFPHYDEQGLCGFEVKNNGFTGFSGGGKKGLWFSKPDQSARTLVFCESAIDAISYYAFNSDHAKDLRVMSTGGSVSREQLELARRSMEKLPPGSRVVLAFDADEGGEKLAEEVLAVAPGSVFVHRELPPVGMGKDWNEALKYQKGIVDRAIMPTVSADHGKTPPPMDMRRYHQKKPTSGASFGKKKSNQR